VAIASFAIIVCSSNIIEFLKDYTALVVLSEIHNAVFYMAGTMAEYGYFGTSLRKLAEKSNEMCLSR